jgi:hypothetical protein
MSNAAKGVEGQCYSCSPQATTQPLVAMPWRTCRGLDLILPRVAVSAIHMYLEVRDAFNIHGASAKLLRAGTERSQ